MAVDVTSLSGAEHDLNAIYGGALSRGNKQLARLPACRICMGKIMD
jgi:hypothetical protein